MGTTDADAPLSDLAALLARMSPRLDPVDYVFETLDEGADPALGDARMLFREDEGITAVRPAASGDSGTRYRRITMCVHSALDAVGFTAAFSRALSDAGIPSNVVAAHHHDHVFVPAADAERAMWALQSLSRQGLDGAR